MKYIHLIKFSVGGREYTTTIFSNDLPPKFSDAKAAMLEMAKEYGHPEMTPVYLENLSSMLNE